MHSVVRPDRLSRITRGMQPAVIIRARLEQAYRSAPGLEMPTETTDQPDDSANPPILTAEFQEWWDAHKSASIQTGRFV